MGEALSFTEDCMDWGYAHAPSSYSTSNSLHGSIRKAVLIWAKQEGYAPASNNTFTKIKYIFLKKICFPV
jgi:hypothetical protein